MRMIAAGRLAKSLPRLNCNLTIGLRRKRENDFGRIDIGFDSGAAVSRSAVVDRVVQLPKAAHLLFGIPSDALAAIAEFVGQRPKRGKAPIGVGIITLDYRDLRRCNTRQ